MMNQSNNSSPISNNSSSSSSSSSVTPGSTSLSSSTPTIPSGSTNVSRLSSSLSPKSFMSSSGNSIPLVPTTGSNGAPIPASITLDDTTGSEHITISYQDDTGVWNFVEPELINHLPLRNIAWRTKTGHTKVVDKMPIEVLHHADKRLVHDPSAELYKKPYLYLYFIHCDDSDLYKTQIKGKIKTWVTAMNERQQEWLIVYVSLGQRRFSELTSKLTRTVYDRIKNDFNVRRDRCCQLRFFDDNNKHEELWEDFLVKMKEGIISSAEQYLTAYEEEIRKLDAKRVLPGWNYLNFFYVKESLAFIYERAQLYEDALMQYYELEVLFTDNNTSQFENISKSPSLSGQPTSGSPDQEEEKEELFLDTSKKPYRELIKSNKISLFDFKHYLFARQSRLLFLLQKPIEVVSRSLLFLTSVSIILKKYTPSHFKPLFRESWIFSTSMEIIRECKESYEKMIASGQSNSSSLASLQKNSKSITQPLTKLLGALGTGFGKSSSSSASSASSSSSSSSSSSFSLSGLSGSQSLNNIQSSQLVSAVQQQQQQPFNRQSLNQSELESRLERQDKETLDFLLGDLLFNATQKLDDLAVALKFIPKNIDLIEPGLVFHSNIEKILSGEIPSEIGTDDDIYIFKYPMLRNGFQSKSNYQNLFLNLLSQVEKYYTQSNRARSMARLSYITGNFYFRLCEFSTAESLFKSIISSSSSSKEISQWSLLEYSIKTKLGYCQKKQTNLQEYLATCVSLLAPGILQDDLEKLHYWREIEAISLLDLPMVAPMSPLFKGRVTTKETTLKYLETVSVQVRIKSYLSHPILVTQGIVSCIKSTPGANNEKLNFTLSNFNLMPGVNRFEFSTLVNTTKSSFIKDVVSLCLGNLSFSHSLRGEGDKSEMKVVDSDSMTKCVAFTTHTQFLQIIQYIGIKLYTNTDQLKVGHFSFFLGTDFTIVPTPSYKVIYTNAEGESRIVDTPLRDFKLPIQEMKSNESMEFYVPVLSLNKEASTHQITVELNHQKQTKEKFSSTLHATFLFINPFTVQSQIIPIADGPGNRIFLKLNLECTSKTLLEITQYSLENCDQERVSDGSSSNNYYLIADYNQSLNRLVYPGQNISLLFEISTYSESQNLRDEKEMILHLKYKNNTQDSPLIRECKPLLKEIQDFSWTIPYQFPNYSYRVDINTPNIGYIGQMIPFEFTITSLKRQQSAPIPLQYQLVLDNNVWMISGQKIFSFTLEPMSSITFKCHIIPISTGSLPIPKPTLSNINSQCIDRSSSLNQSINIYPTSQMFTCQYIQPPSQNQLTI